MLINVLSNSKSLYYRCAGRSSSDICKKPRGKNLVLSMKKTTIAKDL